MAYAQRWTLSARKSGVMADWQPTSSVTSSSTQKGRWMVIAGWTKPDITSNVTQSKPSLTCGWHGNFVNCLNSCSVFPFLLRRNVQCGSLQCKEGDHQPIIDGMDHLFSRTIISIRGVEYECKWVYRSASSDGDVLICIAFSRATSGTILASTEFPEHGLVRDGTPCGENLVCVNQTCVSLFPYIDTSKCPTNHQNVECSGNGVSCCREFMKSSFFVQLSKAFAAHKVKLFNENHFNCLRRSAPTSTNVTATSAGLAPNAALSRPSPARTPRLSHSPRIPPSKWSGRKLLTVSFCSAFANAFFEVCHRKVSLVNDMTMVIMIYRHLSA